MNKPISEARVRFLCRRGMKELDSILQPFFDQNYAHLTSLQQADFATLLESEEPLLWNWLVLQHTVPTRFKAIVECILKK